MMATSSARVSDALCSKKLGIPLASTLVAPISSVSLKLMIKRILISSKAFHINDHHFFSEGEVHSSL